MEPLDGSYQKRCKMSNSLESETPARSIQYQPSETAMATAALRAMAALDERVEIRGPDYLAEIFLDAESKAPLQDPSVRQWVIKNRIAPGAYEFMIARTAYFDHIVKDAFSQNLPQVVFLGAGYDSRSYRFNDLIQETRIFELDALPTQHRKREMLEAAGIPVLNQLTFVPIDFDTENLRQILPAAGFSREQRALFVWEGVTYYLAGEIVDSTLGAIRDLACPGSSICFDYASLSPESINDEAIRKLRQHMKSNHPAEPTRFGIPQGMLEVFLAERGYTVIENLNSLQLEEKFLTLQDGSIVDKVPSLFSIVHARLLS